MDAWYEIQYSIYRDGSEVARAGDIALQTRKGYILLWDLFLGHLGGPLTDLPADAVAPVDGERVVREALSLGFSREHAAQYVGE